MTTKPLERQLVGLANHVAGQGASTRLVYDDHHAGDKLALTIATPDGLFELQAWRLKKGATFHLLASSPAIAQFVADRLGSWHDSFSWTARRSRGLAKRLQTFAIELAATHPQRGTGYPEAVRAQLGQVFATSQVLLGVAVQHGAKGSAELGVDVAGLRDTLWAVAVPIETDDAGPVQRALIYDAREQGFLAPRDVRVELTRTHDLATLSQNWRAWGLAGQAPAMNEHPLTPVDRRTNEGADDSGDTCLGCALEECFYCDIYMCDVLDLAGCVPDCGMPDCDLPDCGGLDCVPCDFS